MIEKLRENAIRALQSSAYSCDGDCGLSEADCFARHPIMASAHRGDDVLTVDAEVTALVDIVLAAVGLCCDGHGQHLYMSTSCLHGDHAYCQSDTGAAGTKTPSQCKFCTARCACGCHSGGAQERK